jgi:hypothetical protein
MTFTRVAVLGALTLLFTAHSVFSEENSIRGSLNAPARPIRVSAEAEAGALKLLFHQLQIGEGSYDFDNEGGMRIDDGIDISYDFYASSAFINGADYPFTGWIYDLSLRAGIAPNDFADVFVNLRLLAAGATGTAEGERQFWTQSRAQPRFTDNRLGLLTVSLGARLH